jgi:uncharacterized protein YcbX
MSIVGRIDSLWRYPVKSMRGEELEEAFVGFAGVYGDRLFAFKSTGCPKGFPYLTGREQREMLLYRPRFRYPEKAAKPPNLEETQALAPNLNPLPADPADLAVEVETPSGEVVGIDDPALTRMLAARMGEGHRIALVRSERALTDCRPVSLFSVQDGFVGRTLRLGSKVTIAVLERDSRCKMITIDPHTAEPSGAILRQVSRAHDGRAGVYGAVLVEGTVHRGDGVELLA